MKTTKTKQQTQIQIPAKKGTRKPLERTFSRRQSHHMNCSGQVVRNRMKNIWMDRLSSRKDKLASFQAEEVQQLGPW